MLSALQPYFMNMEEAVAPPSTIVIGNEVGRLFHTPYLGVISSLHVERSRLQVVYDI